MPEAKSTSAHRLHTNPITVTTRILSMETFHRADIVTIINDYGKEWNNVKVWTQEFKISSPASSTSRLKWTAGSYLFQQDNPVKQATRFGEDAVFVWNSRCKLFNH